MKNGKLLVEAAKAFDLFLTVDQNIKNEQNLTTLPLPIVVLVAAKNTPDALIPFAPFVERVLPTLRPGQLIEIDAAGNATELAPGRA